MRRRAERLAERHDPLEVIGGGALLRRRGRIHRSYHPRGDGGRGAAAAATLGRRPAPGRVVRVVVAAASTKASLGELHVVEQIPVELREALGTPFRLPLGERRERREGKKIGGNLTRSRHPTKTHGLQEPAENLADARGTGGTRHRQQRLRQRAALGAAQTRAKTLHLIRERLEVRVEHLHER